MLNFNSFFSLSSYCTENKICWIIVQQDATVFSLLHISRQLCMLPVLKPTIRSSYNCNYIFPHWLTVMSKIGCLFYSLQLTSAKSCNYSCTSSWWWVSTPETCRTVYRYVINWIRSHLVGQLFNLIHDARTHEYKKQSLSRLQKPVTSKHYVYGTLQVECLSFVPHVK